MRSVDSEVEAMDRPGPTNWFSESSAIVASLNFSYFGVGRDFWFTSSRIIFFCFFANLIG